MSARALLLALTMLGTQGDYAAGAEEAAGAVPGKSFSLRVGQSSRIEGETWVIGFEAVVADSRCPKGETCIWEGDARVRIWAQRADGNKEALEIHTATSKSGAAEFGNWSVRLLRLAPYPLPGRTISQADYVLTLKLVHGPATDDQVL